MTAPRRRPVGTQTDRRADRGAEVIRTQQLDLFAAAPDPARPCMWHPGVDATHRVVIAVDLLDPRWWEPGCPRGRGIDGPYPRVNPRARIPLHVVGAGHCTPCADSDTGAWLNPGTVKHLVPIGGV